MIEHIHRLSCCAYGLLTNYVRVRPLERAFKSFKLYYDGIKVFTIVSSMIVMGTEIYLRQVPALHMPLGAQGH